MGQEYCGDWSITSQYSYRQLHPPKPQHSPSMARSVPILSRLKPTACMIAVATAATAGVTPRYGWIAYFQSHILRIWLVPRVMGNYGDKTRTLVVDQASIRSRGIAACRCGDLIWHVGQLRLPNVMSTSTMVSGLFPRPHSSIHFLYKLYQEAMTQLHGTARQCNAMARNH